MTQPLEGKPLLVAEPKLPLPYLNSLTCSVPFLRKEPPSPTGRVWLSSKSKKKGGVQRAAGVGRWRVLARRLGQAPLRKGQAVERRSRDAAARAGAPAQGQGHQYQHNAGGVRQCSPCAGASPSEGGKIRAPCVIRGLRTAKTPLGGKMLARCIPQRRFAGLFGCIARISCQK